MKKTSILTKTDMTAARRFSLPILMARKKSLIMHNNANLLTKFLLRYVIMIIIEAAYYAARKNKEVKFRPNCGKER